MQGQINAQNILAPSFPARTFSLLLTFLVHDGSSVSFISALWSKDCSLNMSLSSGFYMVPQVTFVGLTGDCYCCVSFTLVTIVIFWSMKSKRCLSQQWMLPFSRTFTFCWINTDHANITEQHHLLRKFLYSNTFVRPLF